MNLKNCLIITNEDVSVVEGIGETEEYTHSEYGSVRIDSEGNLHVPDKVLMKALKAQVIKAVDEVFE